MNKPRNKFKNKPNNRNTFSYQSHRNGDYSRRNDDYSSRNDDYSSRNGDYSNHNEDEENESKSEEEYKEFYESSYSNDEYREKEPDQDELIKKNSFSDSSTPI